MEHSLPPSHPLHRLFQGMTEATFCSELGIADPQLVDYVADLLVRFVPSNEIWKLRDRQGRRIDRIMSMLAEAETSEDEQRRRECHRHVGDYALFWTGVYPEALRTLQAPSLPDQLINYRQQGKRSYYLASTFSGDEAPILRRLSAEFELCAFGLSRVREEWERHDGEGDAKPRRPIL